MGELTGGRRVAVPTRVMHAGRPGAPKLKRGGAPALPFSASVRAPMAQFGMLVRRQAMRQRACKGDGPTVARAAPVDLTWWLQVL